MTTQFTKTAPQEWEAEIAGVKVRVTKNRGGWSDTFTPDTTRPFAVFVDGVIVRTAGGAVRTFGSREAAEKAAETMVRREGRPLIEIL